MAIWSTAVELSKRFVVAEPLLLSYGRRGNLPMRRTISGETFFDEDVVMQLFRRRGSGEWPVLGAKPANLAVLGKTRLGTPETVQTLRKRPVRTFEFGADFARARATGT